jgi:hypothetical protein
MTTSNRSDPPMSRRERAGWQAAIAALLVHVVALGALEHWGRLPAPTEQPYAQVDFVDFEEVETRTMEEAVRDRMEARMNERVTNVSADARARASDEVRSSRAQDQAMSEEVEAELRAFEQAAFDALSDGRDEVSRAGERKADGQDEPLEQYEGWDERVAGQVTAEYELNGRKALNLSIPGYRCRGGGVVLLSIVVSPGGDVLEASVVSAASEGGEAMSSCLETESLRSVRQCRFQSKADAPRRQTGTLTYRFIAQ